MWNNKINTILIIHSQFCSIVQKIEKYYFILKMQSKYIRLKKTKTLILWQINKMYNVQKSNQYSLQILHGEINVTLYFF